MTLGQRYESFKLDESETETASVGINYQNTRWSKVLLRPEIRWDKNGLVSTTDFCKLADYTIWVIDVADDKVPRKGARNLPIRPIVLQQNRFG
jgi:hypothetical protein